MIRIDADPGSDRLLLFEKWLAADQWESVITVWSYNYKPAVVDAGSYTMTLPYRLVTSHPVVDYWEWQTGSVPPMPRSTTAPGGGYEIYNQALTAWYGDGMPTPPSDPDPTPACTATETLECELGGCGAFPGCVAAAVAAVEAYTQSVAASSGAASWSCAEPTVLGAQHLDDGAQMCSFDLSCTVTLDVETGFGGRTICSFEPGACGQISCELAI